MKKKGLLLTAALVVLAAGAFSTTAIASSAGMSMSACSAPGWWPSWLPYYCKER